jgi:hypothetical protein
LQRNLECVRASGEQGCDAWHCAHSTHQQTDSTSTPSMKPSRACASSPLRWSQIYQQSLVVGEGWPLESTGIPSTVGATPAPALCATRGAGAHMFGSAKPTAAPKSGELPPLGSVEPQRGTHPCAQCLWGLTGMVPANCNLRMWRSGVSETG